MTVLLHRVVVRMKLNVCKVLRTASSTEQDLSVSHHSYEGICTNAQHVLKQGFEPTLNPGHIVSAIAY